MPRVPTSPEQKRASAREATDVQMASTNNTANAFFGTKRPAWLTANANARPQAAPAAGPPIFNTAEAPQAAPAAASPTPAATATPATPAAAPAEAPVLPPPTLNTTDPKPAGPTNLSQSDCSLLSPAPTDEASPAAANPDEVIRVDDFASLCRALSEEQQRAASLTDAYKRHNSRPATVGGKLTTTGTELITSISRGGAESIDDTRSGARRPNSNSHIVAGYIRTSKIRAYRTRKCYSMASGNNVGSNNDNRSDNHDHSSGHSGHDTGHSGRSNSYSNSHAPFGIEQGNTRGTANRTEPLSPACIGFCFCN
ncbi:hypothetical protein Sste5344_001911 [Sporothrix stenoceras]